MDTVTKLILPSLLLMAIQGQALSKNVLQLDASVACDSKDELTIRAVNEGAPFKLDESLMPWNLPRAASLEAYALRDGKAVKLKRIGPIEDHLSEFYFGSHQSREGRISIKPRFLGFGEDRSTDYLVFFDLRYQLADIDLVMEGKRGVIFFPKKGLFQSECPILIPR